MQWLLAVTLFAAIAAVYQPAWQGGLIWDDEHYVTQPDLRSLAGLGRIWFELGATPQYYPLAHSVFWLEHKLWGDAVLGYHLVNIFLHAAAALLVAVILRRLAVPGAYLAAAIFALHPVHVESVAWITELKNTLSTVFYLSAALVYLDFDQTRKKLPYFGALALFVLALLTKTVTVTLPAALLVIFWWQRGRLSWRRDVLPLVPFFLLAVATGMLTAWVERKLIGAEGAEYELTLLERCLLAGRVVWFYLGKLLWPNNLTFIYPRWTISHAVWWQYLFPLAVLGLLAVLWVLRRRWRAPLAAALFFVGTLFPVLGFLNIYFFRYSFVADHLQYLASLGIITLLTAGMVMLLDRWRVWRHPVGYSLCLALLATLATLTWRQSQMYADAETLYEATLSRNPGCWLAHNNWAVRLTNAGRLEEAVAHYEKALQINPESAEIHNNLGAALGALEQPEQAVAHFRKALEIDPGYAKAHYNLGAALNEQGRLADAVVHWRESLRLQPENAVMLNELAWVLATCEDASLRNGAEAVTLAQHAVELSDGQQPAILGTLAAAYAEAGRFDEATTTAERALSLALAQNKGALAETLRTRIKLYRSGSAFRE